MALHMFFDSISEDFKQKFQIPGSSHVLWMELYTEQRFALVNNALISLIIGIGK